MAYWTSEQHEAINARDCNLLVAAAAGSGKLRSWLRGLSD